MLITMIATVPRATSAQAAPPARALGPVVATIPVTFGAVSQLVDVGNGRILVADAARRAVTLFDPTRPSPMVVLDSTSGTQHTFAVGSYLIPFRGDSALWYDAAAHVFIIVDPSGTLGRVWTPPNAGARTGLVPVGGIMPASSSASGLVYAVNAPLAASPKMPAEGQPPVETRSVDSAIVVRMNFETRVVDSLARIGTGGVTTLSLGSSSVSLLRETPAFPYYDAVVVTTDGSIAIFHAREYRIEWIGPSGAPMAGPRLTYAWQRITDGERQHLIDSVNALRTHSYDSTLAKRAADSIRTGAGPTVLMNHSGPDGTSVISQPAPAPHPPTLATAAEIPDFHEPTGRSAVLADGDNNVWILPKPVVPTPGFDVWDIVNRQGGVVDRIRIPDNLSIAGFAPGYVYLVARDAGVSTLVKARVK